MHKKKIQESSVKIAQDIDKAIYVMRDASKRMQQDSIKISKWWDLKNLNKDFLSHYAKSEEFYVALVNNKPPQQPFSNLARMHKTRKA